ncbi:MAG: excinuclease ABC subunit C [Erysipelotrichales bacterium]|nr:excinuclease ABC subunit C [Erysipelotrichales bacterium]
MNERIKREIDLLPHRPGCYLMHDKDGKVIYVGKAKDLFKRVSQYFLRSQSGKVFKMVSQVEYFETIITNTEKESLILECNLIQKYYPRFNVLLKDGKSYPYIALKKTDDPLLKIARNKKDKNYDYFGPFPNSGAAYDMLDLLNKLFPIRKCRHIPNSPCLYYHLGQCLGPCINKVETSEYQKVKKKITNFLLGRDKETRRDLVEKMKKASDNLEFEKANEYKNLIIAIDHCTQKQTVQIKDNKPLDVVAYSLRDGYLSIIFMMYRNGNLLGKELYVVEEFNDLNDQLANLIVQFYDKHEIPKKLVLSLASLKDSIQSTFDCEVIVPTRGLLFNLVSDASVNAKNGLDEHFLTARLEDDKNSMLEELGKIAHIPTPYYIELFDNSHLQGSEPIGAMVAFINGEKAKKLYRKFNINHEEARDDYASMREVIYRRYKRLKDENKQFPDLIIVDGGLGQIHAAKEALDAAGVTINLLGLYKNDKHQTDGLMDVEGTKYQIQKDTPLFYLLMRMQDEVHRFAITFHRSKHLKNYKASILDDIENLGIKRKEALMKLYPSVADLMDASIDELSQIVPLKVATDIYNKLHE